MSFDDACVRRDDEEEVATLLVMRDRDSKSIRAWALERKGADLAETVNRRSPACTSWATAAGC